jgi:hypothetical protein
MRETIDAAFKGIISEDCWTIENSTRFEILDPASEDGDLQERCHIVYQDGHFIVENSSNKSLNVLAIDHCVRFEKGEKPCDFAIFDERLFCFADIKNVKRKNRNAARSQARDQLHSSIKVFKEKVNFESIEVRAIMVFTFKQSYPVAKVFSQDAKIRFEDELKAELFEGNSIAF